MFFLGHRIRVTRQRDVVLPAPIVTDDRVYVSCDEENLLCLDSTTFIERWRLPSDHFEPWTAINSWILTSRGQRRRVFSAVGTLLWERDFTSHLVQRWKDCLVIMGPEVSIVDAQTGAVLETTNWPIGDFGSAVVAGNVVIVKAGRRGVRGYMEDPVAAYDLNRRTVLWSRPLHAEVCAYCGFEANECLLFRGSHLPETPLLAWLPDKQRLAAVSPDDGHIEWVAPFLGGQLPPVRIGQLVVGLARDRAKGDLVRAVDVKTGQVVYDVLLGEAHRDLEAFSRAWGPVALGSHIVFTSSYGWLLVLDAATGRVDSAERLKSELFEPVAHGDRLYVTTGSGELLVFETDAAKARAARAATKARAAEAERAVPSVTTTAPRAEPALDLRVSRAEAASDGTREVGASVIEELWGYLEQDWEANRDLLDKVTPGQRLLVVAYHTVNEAALVENLDTFLRGDAGEIAPEAAGALETLGFETAAKKLRAALRVLGRAFPKDAEERGAALDEADEERKERLFAQAEEALGDLMAADEFRLACARYVETHPRDFFK